MKLQIEVQREYAFDLREELRKNDYECDLVIRKAVNMPQIVFIAAATLEIINILFSWIQKIKSKKQDKPKITIINVNNIQVNINLNTESAERVKKILQDMNEKE